MTEEMKKWLEGRPPIIHELAEKFPPGTMIFLEGEKLHVLGYNEDGGLIVTNVPPGNDYALALKGKRTLCHECVEHLEICGVIE